jgi:hypothetical protein
MTVGDLGTTQFLSITLPFCDSSFDCSSDQPAEPNT